MIAVRLWRRRGVGWGGMGKGGGLGGGVLGVRVWRGEGMGGGMFLRIRAWVNGLWLFLLGFMLR